MILTRPTMMLLSAAAMALLAVFAPVPFSLNGTALAQGLPTDDPPVNFRVTGYGHDWISVAWEVPRDRGITYFTLQSSSGWSVEGPTNGGAGHGWSQISAEPDTQYSFALTLQDDSKTTIIGASVSVRTPPTPTDPLTPTPTDPPTPDPTDPPTSDPTDPPTSDPTDPPPQTLSNDATLSTLTLSGINFGTFHSAITSYSAQTANNATETTVTATVNDDGASYKVKLNGVADADGVIPLAVGSNAIAIEVTAEDGATTRIYTVSVTRGDTPRSPNFRVHSSTHDLVYVAWEIPHGRGITSYVLQRYEPDGSASPYARWEGSTHGGAAHGQGDGTVQSDTQYRYVLMLKNDSNTPLIEASVSVRTSRAPSSDPTPPDPTPSDPTPPDPSSPTATTVSVTRSELPQTPPQTPHSLTKISGDGQEGMASAQLAEPFVVSVLNPAGAPLAGVVVSFSVAAGGGLLSSTTATTDDNGQAATRLTLGSDLGTNAVEATVEGLEPMTFTSTATEQAMPHSLTKVSGDGQEGTASAQLAEPFVVSVLNPAGVPLAGVVVSFSVTAGGGLLSSTTATTDANGRAATRLTLGSDLGTNAVEATVEGLEPVTFTAIGQENPLLSLLDAFGGGGKLVALPDRTQLLPNAPNPFNSQTVLSYFLLQPGLVRLEVFAPTGQRVAVLVQGPQQAGYHRLDWNAQDDAGRPLASGIYLYRLVTSEDVLTRKLTLLR